MIIIMYPSAIRVQVLIKRPEEGPCSKVILQIKLLAMLLVHYMNVSVKPFKPEFNIVIFIHYKTLVVDEDDLKWVNN